jgi:hypothetical protein
LPEQTDRWWGQARSRLAVKAAGVLAVFGGGATAVGLSGKLADTPIETLVVLFGVLLISQALTFLGWALLDWLEWNKQRIYWESKEVRLILDLVKEVPPGVKVSSPFFEIDNTGATSHEPQAAKDPPSDPLEAAQ